MSEAEKRVERLASLLRDSECWEHPGWVLGPHTHGEMVARIGAAVDGQGPRANAEWNALRSAIAEVESGAVFGSSTRCAVCGCVGPGIERDGSEGNWGKHYRHVPDCRDWLRRAFGEIEWNPGDTRIERSILRARLLYRTSQKAKPVEAGKHCAPTNWPRTVCPAAPLAAFQEHVLGLLREGIQWDGRKRCDHCGAKCGSQGYEQSAAWRCRWEAPKPASPAPKAEKRECGTCAVDGDHCLGCSRTYENWQPKPPPAKEAVKRERTCQNCGHPKRDECADPVPVHYECWTPPLRRGLAVICKTCAWRCNGTCGRRISPPMPTCWESDGRTGSDVVSDWARRISTPFKPHPEQASAAREIFGDGAWSAPPWQAGPLPGESGNPRGDEWLREVWRKGDHETEILRRVAIVEDALHVHSRTMGRRVDGLRSEVDSIRAGQAAELEKIRDLEAGILKAHDFLLGMTMRTNAGICKRLTALETKRTAKPKRGKGKGSRA